MFVYIYIGAGFIYNFAHFPYLQWLFSVYLKAVKIYFLAYQNVNKGLRIFKCIKNQL